MIIDKLFERVRDRSFVCVGLDTSFDYLPEKYKELGIEEGLFQFNKDIIDNTWDLAAIFKLQIAYYESQGIEGLKGYVKTIEYLKSKDLLVIGDIKRGDIADTGKMYAKAHFESEFEVDFVTLSPYMGYDSIDPYLPYLEKGEKGAFVLLRTSNPGAKDIEYLEHKGHPLYYTIGDNLQRIGQCCVGESGYSALGLVTGGTQSEEAVELREAYKNSFFLIPGYGAQGATAADIRNYLNDLNGGVVNSSRGIILNFRKYEDGEDNVGKYARVAVEDMIKDISGK